MISGRIYWGIPKNTRVCCCPLAPEQGAPDVDAVSFKTNRVATNPPAARAPFQVIPASAALANPALANPASANPGFQTQARVDNASATVRRGAVRPHWPP
jgi:predicted lipid-binding transport protein (Tim44 family)